MYIKRYNINKKVLTRFLNARRDKHLFQSFFFYIKYDILTTHIKYYILKLHHKIFKNKYYIGKMSFKYLIHRYNSIDSERTIEVPFAYDFYIKNRSNKFSFLEVGNVLNNYYNVKHTIVDKYELSNNVINKDITAFNPKKKFKLIISISTIEHIGFDEPIREHNKSVKAIKKLIRLLQKNGKLLITVPLGYNPEIDKLLLSQQIRFSERYFMKRISFFNLWTETTLRDAINKKYNSKYPAANAVAFLIYKNKEQSFSSTNASFMQKK